MYKSALTRFGFSTLLAIALSGCGNKAEEQPLPPPALVIKVQDQAEAHTNSYPGEVRARHEADLAFRISGKLVSRQVEVGSSVKAGDVLAHIDPADTALNAEAARSQALAAETDYTYAKAEYERYQSLLEKKFISPAVFDAKQALFKAAKARLDQANSQASMAGNQAAYASLRADRAGLVTAVMAEPGQVIGAGQPVIKLAQPNEKEVVVAVPENRIAEMLAASAATIRLWAEPDKRYHGKVREVAPNADPLTRTFAAKVAILDAGPEVRLGMTANVAFNAGGPSVVILPLTAVTQKDGNNLVWVVEGAENKVTPRAVKVGKFGNDEVTILAGLKPGERVVSVGVHKLVAGQIVRPIEQSTAVNASDNADKAAEVSKP